ncbi:MAG: O-antigen ligase family protein [Erysipelotrichaceae bacterium]|nr:O-antigen ligase family protein [Erysipelotrichaceae bacterium]
MINKLLKKENIFTLIFVIVALHPFIELDYLLGSVLSIPRLTTILDFVVLPLCVVAVFFLCDRNKKRTLILSLVYGAIFAVYFYIHCRNAAVIQDSIHLTSNFMFVFYDEVVYTVTLLLPLVYVYVFVLSDIGEKVMKRIVVSLSCLIAIPIFISNLFVFGKSTYVGYVKDNFLSWFTLPYNRITNHPRMYATKFFFEEGNTIGILMLMILPFLYYFFYREKDRTKKILLGIEIAIQSLAMIILSTRLATYCSALIPAVMLVIYVVLMLLKQETLKKGYIIFLICMTAVSGFIIPYGPAYQNQLMDAVDYRMVITNEDQRSDARKLLDEGAEFGKWSEAWRDFYVYIFEDYRFLINVTPPLYYTVLYDYKYDPQFWVDVIFDYELEERVNGRQIQTIFTKYKWDELNSAQKLTGFGYSTFMRGGILIERDFVQQYYSYGPVGVVLIMGGWIVLVAYVGIKLLLGYKKGKWTYLNIILLMSVCMGLLCSYLSGHTLDELTTSLFMSLCTAYLLKELHTEKKADC